MSDRNCLTCKWEPEWEIYGIEFIGSCRWPAPFWMTQGWEMNKGSIEDNPDIYGDCPAYEPKEAE